jgi:hypothetical protein
LNPRWAGSGPYTCDLVEHDVTDDRVVQNLGPAGTPALPVNLAGFTSRATCASPVNVRGEGRRLRVLGCCGWPEKEHPGPCAVHGTRSGRTWCSAWVQGTISARFRAMPRFPMTCHRCSHTAGMSSAGSSIRVFSIAAIGRPDRGPRCGSMQTGTPCLSPTRPELPWRASPPSQAPSQPERPCRSTVSAPGPPIIAL